MTMCFVPMTYKVSSCCDLDFDLLTLNSNQFIFVSNCIWVVNLVKFPQAVCKICSHTFVYDHIHGQTG